MQSKADAKKEFRNTLGAHSDLKAAAASLPSRAEFEGLFAFAADFYGVVSDLHGVGAATIPRRVGRVPVRLMESSGIEAPRFDFDD